jgi:hypothetical protein
LPGLTTDTGRSDAARAASAVAMASTMTVADFT